jgi:hypothetical protein
MLGRCTKLLRGGVMLNKSKDAVKLGDCAKKLETKSAKPP